MSTIGRLQSLHEAGLVHGDIKPSNIMIGTEGKPRLIDLGLASGIGQGSEWNLTNSGYQPTHVKGWHGPIDDSATVSYAAPEKTARKPNVDPIAADIFSLGSVFYFLLTGHGPFESATKDGARQQAITNSHAPIVRRNQNHRTT